MARWIKDCDWSNKMSGLTSNNRIHLASSSADLNGAALAQFVIPVIKASQLACMLERAAVAAASCVIVIVDADANVPFLATLPDPVSPPTDTGSGVRLAGTPPATHLTLHPEPVG